MSDNIWDQFERESGSKQWPSTDLEDSPYDLFTCRRCGETFKLQAYGLYEIGCENFDEKAEKILKNHLNECLKAEAVQLWLEWFDISHDDPYFDCYEGDSSCFFCHAYENEKHDNNCIYIRAKTMLKILGKIE